MRKTLLEMSLAADVLGSTCFFIAPNPLEIFIHEWWKLLGSAWHLGLPRLDTGEELDVLKAGYRRTLQALSNESTSYSRSWMQDEMI